MPRRPPDTAAEARAFAEWAERKAAAYRGDDGHSARMRREYTELAKNYRADERHFAAKESAAQKGEPA